MSTTAVPGLLDGAVALVTGAAQGNGAAIARGLAASGASVLVTDVDGRGAESVAGLIRTTGGRADAFVLDVADRGACRAAAERAARPFGDVSILVNNAGIIRRAPIETAEFLDNFDAQIAVNLTGVVNITHALQQQLRRTQGAIVNVGSIASFVAYRNIAAYAATKGAVLQLTKSMAVEFAADGVRVNGIAPGVIATPMTAATRGNPEVIARFMAHTPMGRVGEPDELVGPVVFLASRLASYVTGTMLAVDGGYLAT